jgi:hypothetical protein
VFGHTTALGCSSSDVVSFALHVIYCKHYCFDKNSPASLSCTSMDQCPSLYYLVYSTFVQGVRTMLNVSSAAIDCRDQIMSLWSMKGHVLRL